MGELIAFRLPKCGMRPSPAPIQAGVVLFFTGVRRERMIDPGAAAKRSRRSVGKRTSKPKDAPAAKSHK